jgi:hypothetical protein
MLIFFGTPQEIDIYTMQGVHLHRVGPGEPLPPLIKSGVYIVKIGTTTEQLVVR